MLYFTLRIQLSECFATERFDIFRRAGTRVPGMEICGADRSRTDDIQLAKLALYQLSYSPIKPVFGTGGPRWI